MKGHQGKAPGFWTQQGALLLPNSCGEWRPNAKATLGALGGCKRFKKADPV